MPFNWRNSHDPATCRVDPAPPRPAVQSDAPTTLDVLVKILSLAPEAWVHRPALNLGLVLDRSGSMGGHKIVFAREAAIFTVQELQATDRVSLTIFDDDIETLAPNALVEDKNWLVELIRRIRPGGSTALHGGWEEGARQVGRHLARRGLNRVLLLSDGHANAGVTQADAITSDVHRRALEGITTTTLGLGDDYNEDLLQAMAIVGDGNYYYVDSPAQLPAIVATELRGLAATVGTGVNLAVEPSDGISVAEVLNDFDRLPDGRLKLPNLVAGCPTLIAPP
jgi:Ca-activated chloride channel family protein